MTDPQNQRQPTEEEMMAAYEAQLKQLRVEDVLVQTIVSLVNLGGRKAGLAPGTEDERDPAQLQLTIEGVRALLPLVEDVLGPDANAIRDALSQLQMAFAQSGGAPGGQAGGEPGGQEPQGGQQPPQSGPAQSSGRLWVPGQ